ncbi:MAG: acyltransferase [Bacteroidetes bacterium]|nr:acyltransferase [Bacteroidota bacterium]
MPGKKESQPASLINESINGRNSGFDSLRGIFALMVFFGHVELMKYYSGLEHYISKDSVFQIGRIGVTGFFVLSGFLITVHLLKLNEKAISTGVKLRTFYLKRILRIWPLYYALIIMCLYVFPHISALHFNIPPEGKDARPNLNTLQYYYLFLLPQVPLCKYYLLPFAEPSWSIGVEELFYLFIPLIVIFFKRLQAILIPICLFFIVGRYLLFTYTPNPYYDFWTCMMILSRYDCIIIGCLAGIYFHQQKSFIQHINKYYYIAAVILLVILTLTISKFTYQYAHFAILFAIMILYTASNTDNNILNNKLFSFYGKISFSLYMVHEIAIMFLINNFDFSDTPLITLHATGLAATTALSFITYKIIEEPFVKIKDRIKA